MSNGIDQRIDFGNELPPPSPEVSHTQQDTRYFLAKNMLVEHIEQLDISERAKDIFRNIYNADSKPTQNEHIVQLAAQLVIEKAQEQWKNGDIDGAFAAASKFADASIGPWCKGYVWTILTECFSRTLQSHFRQELEVELKKEEAASTEGRYEI